MATLASIREALTRLKEEVQQALELAATNRRFSDAAELAALAHHLDQSPDPVATGEEAMRGAKAKRNGKRLEVAVSSQPAALGQEPKQDCEYPQFKSLNGSLVKVGWSSKSSCEYRHTVEANAVKHILGCISAAGKTSKFFRPEDVNRAHSANGQKSGSAIPDYQITAILGWLRNSGLVVKRGRTGYVLANPRTFITAAHTALAMLPADDLVNQRNEGA